MSKNLLVDSFLLEYAGLALHARYVASQDEINQHLVGHEFIKVDGAYQEFMGSGADAYRFALVFVGPNWRKDFTAAVAHFKKNPKGLLVHPVHGKKRVGWKSISAPVNVGAETNATTATVQFAEDNLDPSAGQPQTVAAQAQAVTDTSASLDDLVADIPTAATSVISTIRTVQGAATLYAASALAVAQGGPPNPATALQLAGVQSGTVAALSALQQDATTTALVTAPATVRTQVIQLYAQCIALDKAVTQLQPQFEQVRVSGAVSLSRLCADRYGSQASAMRDLALALNRIPNPALIPAGTVLMLPTATV